jgi:hypothetical protein
MIACELDEIFVFHLVQYEYCLNIVLNNGPFIHQCTCTSQENVLLKNMVKFRALVAYSMPL